MFYQFLAIRYKNKLSLSNFLMTKLTHLKFIYITSNIFQNLIIKKEKNLIILHSFI